MSKVAKKIKEKQKSYRRMLCSRISADALEKVDRLVSNGDQPGYKSRGDFVREAVDRHLKEVGKE